MRTSLYGLDVELPFEVAGCPERGWRGERPPLEVVAGDPGLAWSDREAQLVVREPSAGPARLAVHEADGAYRVAWAGIGEFVLTDRRVVCGPGEGAEWERCLTAQVLPLTAVLAGVEVIHASAVVVDGRAVGIVGASGAGKSATAGALVEAGASLLTDDVLALTSVDGGFTAHPGPTRLRLTGPGAKREITVRATATPAPLEALLFLDRTASHPAIGAEMGFRPLAGATFNLLVRTPERLERHLDMAARLAAGGRAVHAAFPPDFGPERIADDVTAWLAGRG